MKTFFQQSIEDTVKTLETNTEKGISEEEAKKRLEEHGENKLQEKAGRTMFQMVLDQFKDFLVLILIAASVVSIGVGEVADGIIIILIVILNAVLGVAQENRASNALKALKEMASPQAKVLRNGKLEKVASSLLVPGDIVILEAGDYVPADVRLAQSVNLKIEEAALTGESVPVEKDAHEVVAEKAGIGDRINSAFMSTVVTYGRGKGIVTGTGMNTEIGHIATMLGEVEEEATPLQKKLNQFGKILGIVCLSVCVVIFALGLLRGSDLLEIFMTAVSLAVASIPEGLTVVVTVVLAIGMQRMVKKHAIMKRLGAVETLGSTTVICTDKTGTLTQNKMTVIEAFDGESQWEVSGRGYGTDGEIIKKEDHEAETSPSLERLLQAGVLCNDAELKKGQEDIIGDPTEGALVVLGAKAGYPRDTLKENYPRIEEIPFDSKRKLMSTFHQRKDDIVMYTKGAPDVIISRCKYILDNTSGEAVPFTEEHKQKIQEINDHFANRALRVLGFAYKTMKEVKDIENQEEDLIFLGLTGMIDPPREEAKAAVALSKRAGIRPVMITGDHKTTASAIAREIGIIESEAQTMDGHEIDEYSDEAFKEKVKKVSVFARVSPQHKVRIVEAIRSSGEIAAMTGDGVNDAPALKRADIGIAMGITGTDVSKEAADMILTDDNFASIVDAVEEGRIIYSNIRKFVGFLLSCNIGELILIFVAMLFGWAVPLIPIQLLWINLMTDSFPALALGMEEKEESIMDQPPRNPKEPIVDRRMGIAIGIQSVALAAAALISFQYGLMKMGGNIEAARTYCFVTLVVGELLRAYSARSETKSLFRMRWFSNRFMNLSVIGSLILLFAVVYVPFLQSIFHTVGLSFLELDVALLFAVIPIFGGEVAKIFK